MSRKENFTKEVVFELCKTYEMKPPEEKEERKYFRQKEEYKHRSRQQRARVLSTELSLQMDPSRRQNWKGGHRP